jgi:DNA processing protein
VANCLPPVTSLSVHVFPDDAGYPTALGAALGWGAMPLHVRGTLPRNPLSVAIVGSRRASAEGLAMAESMARALVAHHVVVVSGGAIGIDAAAHRGALAAGGTTLAVLGTGLDVVYPERNRALFDAIVAGGGALISMFPEGTPARGGNFVARNALVSGLSQAVLVIEAETRSGSLTTARWAQKQRRVLCAVKGSPGTSQLIGAGAVPVSDADDVLAAIAGITLAPLPSLFVDDLSSRVLAAMPMTAVDEETISEALHLPVRTVVRTLMSLESSGLVMMAPGRRYRRTASISAEPIARGSRGQHPN